MKYEERSPVEAPMLEAGGVLWQPSMSAAGGTVPYVPAPDDRYAVIEDMAEGLVVIQYAAWPHLDAGGRLVFDGEVVTSVEPADEAQAAVNRARVQMQSDAPERPLRVGDAFAVGAATDPASGIAQATKIVDISASARRAAKAALLGAAASTVEQRYTRAMAIERGTRSLAPPEDGYFDVDLRDDDRPRGSTAL